MNIPYSLDCMEGHLRHHEDGDREPAHEEDHASGLRLRPHCVHQAVPHAAHGEGGEQDAGEGGVRPGHQVQRACEQERGDVLQIVEVGSKKQVNDQILHIRVFSQAVSLKTLWKI